MLKNPGCKSMKRSQKDRQQTDLENTQADLRMMLDDTRAMLRDSQVQVSIKEAQCKANESAKDHLEYLMEKGYLGSDGLPVNEGIPVHHQHQSRPF